MASAIKQRPNILGFQAKKSTSISQPIGPSVSGGTISTVKPESQTITVDSRAKIRKERSKSNESYDSDSSADARSPDKWPKNALQILKSRMQSVVSEKPSLEALDKALHGSLWETTKNETVEKLSKRGGKRKSKRHCSLDAKTARFYAKRDQSGWTPLGQKGSPSSSDDDGGFKRLRERSPRRKHGSRESSSLNSRTPSRDPSVISHAPPARIELSPSSTGVVRPYAVTNITKVDPEKPTSGQSKAFKLLQERRLEPQSGIARHVLHNGKPVAIPKIHVTNENGGYAIPNVKLSSTVSPDISPLEEWLNARPLSKSSESASTQSLLTSSSSFHNLLSSSQRPIFGSGRPLRHAQSHMEISSVNQVRPISSAPSELPSLPEPAAVRPSHLPVRNVSNVSASSEQRNPVSPIGSHIQVNGVSRSSSSTWNHPKSRHSLPAGMNSSALNLFARAEVPRLVPSFPQGSLYEGESPIEHHSPVSNEPPKSPDRSPVVPSQASRHGLLLSSARSTEFLLIGAHVMADSKFLHNALRISNTASHLLNDTTSAVLTPSQPGKPLDSPTEASSFPMVPRWNSDWQLHQSSSRSGIYRPIRSESLSHRDRNRLNVPSRMVPLSGPDSRQLEQALEELDEFYESLSTKSEDATLKSSSNIRSDSGVSSPRHAPEEPVSPKSNALKSNLPPAKDREEYTKQWIHDERHSQSASNQSINLPVDNPGSPWARLPRRTSADISSTKSVPSSANQDIKEKHDKTDRVNSEKTLGTVFNSAHSSSFSQQNPNDDFKAYRADLEFPNYPNSKKRQPHVEIDDVSVRKSIQAQNTPQYRVNVDMSKQFPSFRNDYVKTANEEPRQPTKSPSKVPDVARDDVAFRMLRNDQKIQKSRPQTLDVDTKPLSKSRVISNSIRNLARHFEAKSDLPKSNSKFTHAVVQINGQKIATRSPYNTDGVTLSRAHMYSGLDSPKVSPMDDKQMDDLLLTLNSVPSSQDLLSDKLRRSLDTHSFSNLSSLTKRMGLQTGAKTAVSF